MPSHSTQPAFGILLIAFKLDGFQVSFLDGPTLVSFKRGQLNRLWLESVNELRLNDLLRMIFGKLKAFFDAQNPDGFVFEKAVQFFLSRGPKKHLLLKFNLANST